MTDSTSDTSAMNPFDPAEPPRDEELAALLRQVAGDVPLAAVNWDALAERISRSLPQRAATTWWGYAARWERRMLPIALAASLLGAIALWNSAGPAPTMVAQLGASDIVAEVAQGTTAEDAASSFARTITADANIGELGLE